jgi:hypothetical protein
MLLLTIAFLFIAIPSVDEHTYHNFHKSMSVDKDAILLTIKVQYLFSDLQHQLPKLDERVEWVARNVDGTFELARQALKLNVPQIKAWFNELRRRDLLRQGSSLGTWQLQEVDEHLCKVHLSIEKAYKKLKEGDLYKHDESKLHDQQHLTRKSVFIHLLFTMLEGIVTGVKFACRALYRDREAPIALNELHFNPGDAPLKHMFVAAYSSVEYLFQRDAAKWSNVKNTLQTWGNDFFEEPFTLDLYFAQRNVGQMDRELILQALSRILFYLGKP